MASSMRYRRTLADLVKALPPNPVGIECGVWRAELSLYLFENVPGLRLHLVDSWRHPGMESEYWRSGDRAARQSQDEQDSLFAEVQQKLKPLIASSQAIVHRLDSLRAADSLRADYGTEAFDFVFIDADHTSKAVWLDLLAYWPLVRPGGLFSGHDYDHPRYHGVKDAVDTFAGIYGLTVNKGQGKVWWMWKPQTNR